MKDFELIDEDVIDLGQASVETRGIAVFQRDTDGGQLRYAAGIAAE